MRCPTTRLQGGAALSRSRDNRGKGRKILSHCGGTFPWDGLLGGSLGDRGRGERTLEAHPDEVKVVAVNNTNDLCLQLSRGFGRFGGQSERRYRDLDERLHGKRERPPRSHQNAPGTYVQPGGKLQGLLTITSDTAKENGEGQGQAVPLSLFPVMCLTVQGLDLGALS